MSEAKLPPSPFKGLVPFSEEDAPFFFGRKRESRIITANLETRRFTLLYGPSGVGKSSVINAGVAHGLRQREQGRAQSVVSAPALAGNGSGLSGRLDAADARPGAGGGHRPTVVVVFDEWSGDPLAALRDKIIAEVRKSAPGVIRPEAEPGLLTASLPELLRRLTDPRGVKAAGPERVELLGPESIETPALLCEEVLVILDQFEEYFLYHPAEAGEERFAEEFTRAVVCTRLRSNFLVSIREDWLARLDRFKGRIPGLFDNSIGIEHLSREAAREAIEGPVAGYNRLLLNYGGKPPKIEIQRAFTDELLSQLEKLNEQDAGEAGRESVPSRLGDARPAEARIQARHLQIVLENLWAEIRKQPTPTFGAGLLPAPDTAGKIIQSHIGGLLNKLTHKEKRVAAKLFRYLITPQGTKIAYTPEELAGLCGRQPAEVSGLLSKLSASRIKVLHLVAPSPNQPKGTRYQLTSDVLAAPLIDWREKILTRQRRTTIKWRWVLIVFVGLLLVTLGIAVKAYLEVERERRAANEQRDRAEAERAKAQLALDIFQKFSEGIPYAKALLRGHAGTITSASFIGDGQVLTASNDGSAIVWDVETKKIVSEFKEALGPLTCATISPDGKLLVAAAVDGTVTLWRMAERSHVQLRAPGGGHVTDIRFSPRGDLLAAATTQGLVVVWNVDGLSLARELKENTRAIRQLGFNPDGTYLAAASEDHSAVVWRVGDWSPQSLKAHTGIINGFAFSPKDHSLVTVSADATVRLWNLTNGATRLLGRHDASVNGVAFDREGGRVVTASDDKTARVWKLDDPKPVVLSGHEDQVLSADFAPSGREVVTGSKDNTARIWSASTGQSRVVLRGHLDEVTRVVFSPDGKFVLTASDDATARIWFAQTSELVIEQPTIDAVPNHYVGQCPATIRFFVTFTAASGVGTVQYRFRGSDGRIWPVTEKTFTEPGSKYVNWYWTVRDDYAGSMTVEVVEPQNIKPQKAVFRVNCKEEDGEPPPPSPGGETTVPSPTPVP